MYLDQIPILWILIYGGSEDKSVFITSLPVFDISFIEKTFAE